MEDSKRRKLFGATEDPSTSEAIWTSQDKEAGKIGTDKVFSISLVTDCIFKSFSTSDLLSNCSLVSKIWNSAVKEYLHRCRKCTFVCNLRNLRKLEDQCNILKTRLPNACLPYNGIKFVITPNVTTILSDDIEELKSILREVIPLIDTTRVRIRSDEDPPGWRKWGDFSSKDIRDYFDLLFSSVLFPLLSTSKVHHLRIERTNRISARFWNKWLENVENEGFSTLETIEPYLPYTKCCVEDFEALLRTCPKIKNMPMDVTLEAVMAFDKYNKMDLVKVLIIWGSSAMNFDSDRFNALSKIQNNLLRVHLTDLHGWTPEQYEWIGRILQLHSKSIRTVHLKFVNPNRVESSYESISQVNFPPLLFVKVVLVKYFCHKHSGNLFEWHQFRAENNQNFKEHPNLLRIFPKAKIVPRYGLNGRIGSFFLKMKS